MSALTDHPIASQQPGRSFAPASCSAVPCAKCGCLGNCSCGHEPLDEEKGCTLNAAEICPCCRARRSARDRAVRDLPVKAKLRQGQIIVEQPICGIIFSLPAAVWPSDPRKQLAWVTRLTPWWDMDAQDWTPQAHRLRESCLKAINNLKGAAVPGNREHPATDGMNATSRSLLPNDQAEPRRAEPDVASGNDKQ